MRYMKYVLLLGIASSTLFATSIIFVPKIPHWLGCSELVVKSYYVASNGKTKHYRTTFLDNRRSMGKHTFNQKKFMHESKEGDLLLKYSCVRNERAYRGGYVGYVGTQLLKQRDFDKIKGPYHTIPTKSVRFKEAVLQKRRGSNRRDRKRL